MNLFKGKDFEGMGGFNKYANQAVRWEEYPDHYELIFTDDFITPSSSGIRPGNAANPFRMGNSILTDIIMDMRRGDKSRELHVFVGSFGGEVAALNMILQQLLTYEYRVGINLGTACSCGWMLFFACQERYVSPFSQAMYHDISSVCGGKHSELHLSAEFMGRWQKELLKITDTAAVLTEKELELGRTTEVWFTGRELIDRGAAKDYNDYLSRQIPYPSGAIAMTGNRCFTKIHGCWTELEIKSCRPVEYQEVLAAFNQPSLQIAVEQKKDNEKRKTAKRTKRRQTVEKRPQNENSNTEGGVK